MAKTNYTVALEKEEVDRLLDMGLTLAGFVRDSLDKMLSEEYDDYRMFMKARTIEEDLLAAREERESYKNRIKLLDIIIDELEALHEDNVRAMEFAVTVGRLHALTQELNQMLIMCEYDVDKVRRSTVVKDIRKLNKGFDLQNHRDRLMKIMGY